MAIVRCPECGEATDEFEPNCKFCGALLPCNSGDPNIGQPSDGVTATTHEASSQDLIGRRFSHYEVIESLGRGGMGVVYRARDVALGRSVALKFLSPKLSRDSVAKARFIREAQAASALDDPNIGTIYEIGEHDAQLFIVMAYYEGQTLRERLAHGPLPIAEVQSVLMQLACALSAARRAGIVHRDLKPANVMLTCGGRVKLLDFGLAKLTLESAHEDVSLTRSGQVMGTVAYMSPEQARGQPLDPRTDLWSLGIVAYEMLTGTTPFDAESPATVLSRILHDAPRPLRTLRAEVPETLERIVSKLLSKEREHRPQDADEVLRSLELAGGPETTAAPAGIGEGQGARADGERSLSELPTDSELVAPRRRGHIPRRLSLLIVLLVLTVIWAAGSIWYPIYHARPASTFHLLVAPFYTATDAARQEAQVTRQLLYTSIVDTLQGNEGRIQVELPDVLKPPLRQADAIELAQQHDADAIIWGQLVSLGVETRIEPRVTVIRNRRSQWQRAIGHGLEQRSRFELKTTTTGEFGVLTLHEAKAKQIANLGIVLAVASADLPDRDALQLLRRVPTADSYFLQARISYGLVSSDRLLSITPDGRIFVSQDALRPRAKEASTLHRRALEKDPAHALSHEALGSEAFWIAVAQADPAASSWMEAESHFGAALQSSPSFVKASIGRSRCLIHMRQVDRARQVLESAREHNPDDLELAQMLAYVNEWSGKRKEARALIAELRRATIDADQFRRAPRVFAGFGLYAPQAEVLQRAFDGEAADLNQIELLAESYCALGEPQRAAQIVERTNTILQKRGTIWAVEEPDGIFVFPEEWIPTIQSLRWKVAAYSGDLDAAMKLFAGEKDISLDLSPTERPMLLRQVLSARGITSVLRGNFEDATGTPLSAAARDVQGNPGWLYMLICLKRLGLETAAEDLLQEIRPSLQKTRKNNLDPYSLVCLYTAGLRSEAEVLAYNPLEQGAWWIQTRGVWDCSLAFYMGLWSAAQGDGQRARKFFKQSVATGMKHRLEWLLATRELERAEQ